MVHPVIPFGRAQIGSADPFDRTEIDSKVRRVGSPAVVRINPAGFAKVMLRGRRIPLIKREISCALQDRDIILMNGNRGCCATAAKGTVTAGGL